MNLQRIEEIIKVGTNYGPNGLQYEELKELLDLASLVLKAPMVEDKPKDYSGSGGNEWVWEELRKEGWNDRGEADRLAFAKSMIGLEETIAENLDWDSDIIHKDDKHCWSIKELASAIRAKLIGGGK